MFTFFTAPKKFTDDFYLIQKNAILSWRQFPDAQVILFGDEVGISEFASSNNVEHVCNLKTNEYGTPVLSSIFESAIVMAKYDVLIYSNSDIIFMPDLIQIIEFIKSSFTDFLIVGRRLDIDVKYEINYNEDWISSLMDDINSNAVLHSKSGIDYFIFRKSTKLTMPPLVVGRPSWDNWMIYYFLKMKYSVIDSTLVNKVIHQNHKRGYLIYGKEANTNMLLAGGKMNLCDISHSNYSLNKLNENLILKKNFFSFVKFSVLYRRIRSIRFMLIDFYLINFKNIK